MKVWQANYIILGKVHIFWEGHKICEIYTVDWTGTIKDKSTVEISQHFVAFSEYMNFNNI